MTGNAIFEKSNIEVDLTMFLLSHPLRYDLYFKGIIIQIGRAINPKKSCR